MSYKLQNKIKKEILKRICDTSGAIGIQIHTYKVIAHHQAACLRFASYGIKNILIWHDVRWHIPGGRENAVDDDDDVGYNKWYFVFSNYP